MDNKLTIVFLILAPILVVIGNEMLNLDIFVGLVVNLGAILMAVTGSYYRWVKPKNRSKFWLLFPGFLTAFGYIPLIIMKDKREFEESEDPNWFKQVDQLKRQFDDLNSEVLHAMKTESTIYLLPAFERVESEMPELIQKLESLAPQSEKIRQSWAFFIEALKTYLLSCQHLKRSLKEYDEQSYKQGIKLMKEATRLLKEQERILKR